MASTTEHERLQEARESNVPWRKWGPYLSERQWGTVREDYSDNGDAWNYFTHDQARSRRPAAPDAHGGGAAGQSFRDVRRRVPALPIRRMAACGFENERGQ